MGELSKGRLLAAMRPGGGAARRRWPLLGRLLADTRGVTALEYGVIAGVIIVALATAIAPIGGELAARFADVAAAMP